MQKGSRWHAGQEVHWTPTTGSEMGTLTVLGTPQYLQQALNSRFPRVINIITLKIHKSIKLSINTDRITTA